MSKKTKSNISPLELPFPKTWLGKKIKDPRLEEPVLAAQGEFIGFKEHEIKSLYVDLEKVIDAYKSHRKDWLDGEKAIADTFSYKLQLINCPIDLSKKPAADYLCISSMIIQDDFIPWKDFINKWGIVLECPFEGTSHGYDLETLPSRRLLAVLILHYASKGDAVRAQVLFHSLIGISRSSDLELQALSKALEEKLKKNKASKEARERVLGSKKNQANKSRKNECSRLILKYTKNLTVELDDELINDINKELDKFVEEDPLTESMEIKEHNKYRYVKECHTDLKKEYSK